MPVESGNQAIKDGTLGTVMQRAAERWKPEAMYFTTFDGLRTAFMVFDLPEASGIPPFAEPFFRELNASVQLAPAMNGDDLQKGLSQLGLVTGCRRQAPCGDRARADAAAGEGALSNCRDAGGSRFPRPLATARCARFPRRSGTRLARG